MEDGEEEEKKEEEEEKEEEEKSEKMVQLWRPEKFQRDYIINDPSVMCGSLGKVAGADGQDFSDVLEKVKAAVGSNKPQHPRTPLSSSRTRKRKTQSEVGTGRVLSEGEKEWCVNRCVTCNYEFTDSDWSQFKSKGWEVQVISHYLHGFNK